MKIDPSPAEEKDVGLAFNYRRGIDPRSPLVILVHGRAGNKNVMWAFERCVPTSWAIVAFQASLSDELGGWSWWQMTKEGSSRAAIMEAAATLNLALTRFCERFSFQPRLTIGCGFSQGAVLVSAAGFGGSIHFDGMALLAGFALLPADGRPASTAPQSVFVAHGASDEIIPIERARSSAAAIKSLGIPVDYVEEEVGHKIGIKGTRELRDWFSRWDSF